MGIRESLKEQSDELNIKNFTMPEDEPEQEHEFDVEKEITPEIWQRMKEKLDELRQKKDLRTFAALASPMLILRPEKRTELNIDNLYDEMLIELKTARHIKEELGRIEKADLDNYNRILAQNMALLFPEKRKDLMTDKQWEEYAKEVMSFSDADNIYGLARFVNGLYELIIMKPERASQLSFDDKIWQEFKSILDEERDKRLWLFTHLASRIYILNSDKKEEFHIDKKTWKGIKADLKKEFKKELSSFVNQAVNALILSAKEAKITDHGLELIMPEKQSYQQKIPPRPERRQF